MPTESYKKIMSDNYLSYSTLKAFKVDDIIFCSGLTQCGDLIFYQGTSRENYVNYILYVYLLSNCMIHTGDLGENKNFLWDI